MAVTILLFPHAMPLDGPERDMIVQALTRPSACSFPDAQVEILAPEDLAARLAGHCDAVLCALEPLRGQAPRLLRTIKELRPDCPVLWYRAPEEEEIDSLSLAEAMRNGLSDYLGRLDAPAIPLNTVLQRALSNAQQARAAQVSLHTSEQNFRLLFDAVPQPMWVFDPLTLRFLAVNQAAINNYGYTREEFMSMRATDIRPPEEYPQFRSVTSRIAQGDHRGVWTHRRKDGTEMEVLVSWHKLGFAGQDAIMVTANDVTELHRADRALRESEERYRMLFESNPQPMWVVDLETCEFLAVNDAAIKHYGYTREEFLSMRTTEIRPAEENDRLLEHLAFIRKVPDSMGDAGVWQHYKKDGSLIEAHISWHSLRFLGRPAELVLVNDVTEKRRLEEQLRQAARMEAIGQLAGGVAHDFNNLLGLIIGYSELLLEGLGPVDPRRRSAEEIRVAGQRAASLTRQLLAFSRRQVLKPEVILLNDVLERTGKMLRRLIGEDIELVFKLDPKLHSVLADPGQIEQVLLNLSVNARDAMPDGGLLTVETANVNLDAAYARVHSPIQPGPYVMLAVSDTGHGMDTTVRSHIFEPFFTTKVQGKGTGLGLATVYGIVKQSGGFIWVYSEPGKGAAFKIYLPPTGLTMPVPAPEDSVVAPQGKESLLLVEDEAPLRELAADFLRACGYHVLEAGNGNEALETVSRNQGGLDLLVTDVVMPGMSGRQLAQKLATQAPGIKVLYLSGYTDEAIHRHGVLEPGVAFLQKPFRLADLARRTREVLDSATEFTA